MTPIEYHAVFPGRFSSLQDIAEFVRNAAKEAGLDRCATYTVETAVDEACSNIIEHAYGGENKGDIDCTCAIDESRLTIVLMDHGITFDPEAVPLPKTKAALEERKASGLGLYFMRQMMDEVHFDFQKDERNVLTMVKYK